MAIPQKSIQTLEGQLVLALNIAVALGVAIAAGLDIAAKEPIFSRYATQLSHVVIGIGTLDGWFLTARTYLKAQLGDTTTINTNTVTASLPATPPADVNPNLSSGVAKNG